jgi:PAS domain S-box-containing protein
MENYAIVMADRAGTIRGWNGGAEALFGHRPSDAIGQTLDLIVPELFRDQHWNGFRHAMETGSAKLDGQSTEIPVKCADGNVTVFPGAFMLLRDAERRVIGAMVVFGPRPQ